jgi:hypothetical protein
MPENCTNGVDDDCNGFVDCADPACFGNRACVVPGREICNNGIDDNDNGLVDCADPQCVGSPACVVGMGIEICDNGIDDNGNGLVDCADPQCAQFAGCLAVDCHPDVDFGTLAPHGADVSRDMDTRGSSQTYMTCAPGGGVGRVGRFVLTTTTDLRLDLAQGPGGAHAVGVFRAGASQACDQNPVACVNAMAAPAQHTFAALAGGTYWLIVEAYPGTPGDTTVRLSTGSATIKEICDNGIDDDGNGLIDCQDAACVSAPNCVAHECVPDIAIGALIMDGPAQSIALDTTGVPNRFHPTCAGTSMGGDVTMSFTLPAAGGVLLDYSQTGAHAFGLFVAPGPGLACDTTQHACLFPSDASGASPSGSISFSGLPPGQYVFIIKSMGPAQEGPVQLRIGAFVNRQVEICDNGIDDDGNGLIDCADPACFGVAGCTAAPCTPNTDLGTLGVGQSQSLVVDVTAGQDLYQTTCAQGSGKEQVIRFTTSTPMGLGVSCTETGSQVLELSQQLAPLDACNAHPINCADPTVIPFGCNFVMPNLQPGTYNLIVDAFQEGSEGAVDLTLSGVAETITEICNNGIDDNGNGLVDCADPECVTSPSCERFACRAGQSLGLLMLNGRPISVSVTTVGAGDNESSMCTSGAGGQDVDIDFQLPGTTDLTIQWAQLGKADFAIFSNEGRLFSCDAGSPVACIGAAQQPFGQQVITGLPAGSYHLIVDADVAGTEGPVGLEISGVNSP